MADALEKGTFEPHVDSEFDVTSPDGHELRVTLVSVDDGPEDPLVEQFSLLFRGPAQGIPAGAIHTVEHAELGTQELYLERVLHPDREHTYYESCFCRLRE